MAEKTPQHDTGVDEVSEASPATPRTPGADRKKKTGPPKADKLPPYKLILHNDDVNSKHEVIRTIVKLTPLNLETAVRRMLEAHTRGRAILLTTHKERAELYRDQFKSCQLTTTIEPA